MGPDEKLPSDWRVAVAVAVGVVAIIGWTESRMGSIAEASVSHVAADIDKHKAVDEESARHLKELIEQVKVDSERTRRHVERLVADCYARGGCR